MIALALVMIRARFAHAVTLFFLSMAAIGAAVAGPTYVEASQRSVVASVVASAPNVETTLIARDRILLRVDPGDPRSKDRVAASQARQFDRHATETTRLAGFDAAFAIDFEVAVATSAAQLELAEPLQSLAFRAGACERLEIVAGRCAAGPGEVMIDAGAAERLELSTGSTVLVQPKRYIFTPEGAVLIPTGAPSRLSIVGVYRPRDASDLFWGLGGVRGGNRYEPFLVDRVTLAGVDHPDEAQSVIAYPRPGTLTAERLASLGEDLAATTERMRQAGITPLTSMKDLLERVQANRDQAAILPTMAAIPLILLCCLVVFLAAASTAQARRTELGMLSLRGAWAVDRWWLGSAEVVLPVLAGGTVGYLFGQTAVWLFTRLTLTGPWPATFSTGAMPQALVALLAALMAGLLALRHDLAAPTVDLLRRVPGRGSPWLARLAQTVVVAVAVAAVVQLRSGGALIGVSVLAPAVVVLAVALVLSAGFDPLMRWWGSRALRRGHPGLALGALHLGRRGGGSRMLALLAVAVGLVAFAAIGSEIGTQGRAEQVSVNLGATRVLSVQPISGRELLHAVRAVDPEGAYAMAVVPMRSRNSSLPVLAVDTTRLGTVARWPATGGLTVDQVAASLRPTVDESVVVRGTGIALTLDVAAPGLPAFLDQIRGESGEQVHADLGVVRVVLAPLDGSPVKILTVDELREGRHDYARSVGCEIGCRISHLQLVPQVPVPVSATVSSVRQTGPDAVVAGPAELARWLDRLSGEPSPAADGAGVALPPGQNQSPTSVGPADRPSSLLTAVTSADTLAFILPAAVPDPTVASAASGAQAVRSDAQTSALPRVGGKGALVDLELLTRMAEPGLIQIGEVWLGPAAPADAVERLRAVGLEIYRDRTLANELSLSEQRPNAVGLRFLLAMGLLCLVLGVGGLTVAAGVERRARAEELRALRTQGLSRRAVTRAGRVSYLLLVLAAALVGAVAAAGAWLAVGDLMPLVDPLVPGLPVPRWPGIATTLSWAGATLVLATAAYLLTLALSRAANTRYRGSNR